MFSVSLQYIKESELRKGILEAAEPGVLSCKRFFITFFYSIKYLLGAPVTKLRPLGTALQTVLHRCTARVLATPYRCAVQVSTLARKDPILPYV